MDMYKDLLKAFATSLKLKKGGGDEICLGATPQEVKDTADELQKEVRDLEYAEDFNIPKGNTTVSVTNSENNEFDVSVKLGDGSSNSTLTNGGSTSSDVVVAIGADGGGGDAGQSAKASAPKTGGLAIGVGGDGGHLEGGDGEAVAAGTQEGTALGIGGYGDEDNIAEDNGGTGSARCGDEKASGVLSDGPDKGGWELTGKDDGKGQVKKPTPPPSGG